MSLRAATLDFIVAHLEWLSLRVSNRYRAAASSERFIGGSVNSALAIVGIVCLAAAVVGGGVKLLGNEIPLLDSLSRQLLIALVGVVALILAATVGRPSGSGTPNAAPPTSEVTTPPATSLGSPTEPSGSVEPAPESLDPPTDSPEPEPSTDPAGATGGPNDSVRLPAAGSSTYTRAAVTLTSFAIDLDIDPPRSENPRQPDLSVSDAQVVSVWAKKSARWTGRTAPSQQQCHDLAARQAAEQLVVPFSEIEDGNYAYCVVTSEDRDSFVILHGRESNGDKGTIPMDVYVWRGVIKP